MFFSAYVALSLLVTIPDAFANGTTPTPDAAPACDAELDPRVRLDLQLRALMSADRWDVTRAKERLTKSDIGSFLGKYVPLHLDLLTDPRTEVATAKVGFLAKIGLREDSSGYLNRIAGQPAAEVSLLPREDQALWMRYYLMVHPTQKFDGPDLRKMAGILFSGPGPLGLAIATPESRSVEERIDVLKTLEAFLKDRWNGVRTSKYRVPEDLIGPATRSWGLNSGAFEDLVARDYTAGRLPNGLDVSGYLVRELNIGQFLSLISKAAPEELGRIKDLLDRNPKRLAPPELNKSGVEAIKAALAELKHSPAKKRLIVQMIAIVNSKGDTDVFNDVLATVYLDDPNDQNLELVLSTSRRANQGPAPTLVATLIANSNSNPVTFRTTVESLAAFHARQGIKSAFWTSQQKAIEGPLLRLLKQSQDLDWDRWAIATARTFKPAKAKTFFRELATTFRQKHPTRDTEVLLQGFYADASLNLEDYYVDIVFARTTPSVERVSELLSAIAGNPRAREALQSAASYLVSQDSTLSPRELKRYSRLLPDLAKTWIATAAKSLAGVSEGLSPIVRSQILRHQKQVEEGLSAAWDTLISSATPPEGLTWMELIGRMPRHQRYHFVSRLLEAHRNSAPKITQLIAALEPEDGVREAVADHLPKSPLTDSSRSDFDHAQVRAMFGNGRLRKFFPHIFEGAQVESGAIRTTMMMAVFSAGKNGLHKGWLAEKMLENVLLVGVHSVLGFRPALGYSYLIRQMNRDFEGLDGVKPLDQIRGLVVQGNYEKRGHSIMKVETNRGESQVEAEASQVNDQIEQSLRSNKLHRERRLIQRLFVYNWSLNADDALIDRIRRRAAYIAANTNGSFWNMRVEIHNFPNRDILQRVKAYQEKYPRYDVVDTQLIKLIEEIEQLLDRSLPAQEQLDDTIDSLLGNEGIRAQLKETYSKAWSLPLVERLKKLASLRNDWMTLRQANLDTRGKINALLGDHTLSDFVQGQLAREIAQMQAPSTPEELRVYGDVLQGILDHVALDDLLTEKQTTILKRSVDEFVAAPEMTMAQRTDAVLRVIQSAIDQSHQTLQDEFGRYDQLFINILPRGTKAAEPFADDVLRSSNVLMLSLLADQVKKPVEVFNAGRAIGTLRLDPDISRLAEGDIPVFSTLPPQIDPVAGIITLAVGSRLSHLQLLSRSLKIPNVKVDRRFRETVAHLDGKKVMMVASPEGHLDVREVKATDEASDLNTPILVPKPNRSVDRPILLSRAGSIDQTDYAGPKSMQLARLMTNAALAKLVPDGVVLPFGYFNRYVGAAGLRASLRTLRLINVENRTLVARVSESIRNSIQNTPIPAAMLAELRSEIERLDVSPSTGFFIRSDTNVEDLDDFNGAGLNESVPNVPRNDVALDRAIRKVWSSAFSERAIYWRAKAVRSALVVMAEPSVLVQPTINAESSGVITSRGAQDWQLGRGLISADAGIAAVVEADAPVEEWTLASGVPRRLSYTMSSHRSVIKPDGGLRKEETAPGSGILWRVQAERLNEAAVQIDRTLGDRPHGWDIEWAFENGTIRILQARPNF